MGRDNHKKIKEEPKDCTIFAFLTQDSSEFFVGYTWSKYRMALYHRHYHGDNRKTADAFAKGKLSGNLPKMYVLEEIKAVKPEAYRHCVAWSKYFMDHAMKPLVSEMIDFTNNFDDKTVVVYEAIKNEPFDELCGEGKDLFPNYGKKSKFNTPNKEKTAITINMTPEEYKETKAKAEKEYMSLSAYCRQCVKHGYILNVDCDFLLQYIDDLRKHTGLVEGIVTTILVSGKYFPADLENISIVNKKLMSEIQDAKQEIVRLTRQLRRMVE